MFEIPAERSENENEKMDFEAQKRASRISRWSKSDVLNMNINIPGSKVSNIIQEGPKTC